ncbi:hypothetical protein BpHYR1_007649 [Brachionus plicatilis]|uniref:Uncharacterized protein n=1 Tax=Brachionus plicatilis TaxID=10195 RepID=A0A3M7RXX1_BRAPC|nr:hypothetical protein BpHYR1_007649 [Brachionus plicatilis]
MQHKIQRRILNYFNFFLFYNHGPNLDQANKMIRLRELILSLLILTFLEFKKKTEKMILQREDKKKAINTKEKGQLHNDFIFELTFRAKKKCIYFLDCLNIYPKLLIFYFFLSALDLEINRQYSNFDNIFHTCLRKKKDKKTGQFSKLRNRRNVINFLYTQKGLIYPMSYTYAFNTL